MKRRWGTRRRGEGETRRGGEKERGDTERGRQGEGETRRGGDLTTSHILHSTSDILHLTFDILHPKSDIQYQNHSALIHLPESITFPLVTIRQIYMPASSLPVLICCWLAVIFSSLTFIPCKSYSWK